MECLGSTLQTLCTSFTKANAKSALMIALKSLAWKNISCLNLNCRSLEEACPLTPCNVRYSASSSISNQNPFQSKAINLKPNFKPFVLWKYIKDVNSQWASYLLSQRQMEKLSISKNTIQYTINDQKKWNLPGAGFVN